VRFPGAGLKRAARSTTCSGICSKAASGCMCWAAIALHHGRRLPHVLLGERVLPGMDCGTAGAVRYRLPEACERDDRSHRCVWLLLGTVMSDGAIQFEFSKISLTICAAANAARYPTRWSAGGYRKTRTEDAQARACGAK